MASSHASALPASEDLAIARRAAEAGGRVLASYFRTDIDVREKHNDGLVTIADTAAEDAIAAIIRAERPKDAILAEEHHRGDATAKRVWVVDPLDGTTNFAHGIAQFAVSIALWCDGEPALGIVLDPIAGSAYEAVRGHGSFRDGERLRASTASRLRDALVATGFSYDRATTLEETLAAIRSLMLKDVHGIRRFGAASLDLCMVASGAFTAFFEYKLAPWDFAAGCLIAEEAGATVTRPDGRRLSLASGGVLASARDLHASMVELLALEPRAAVPCRPAL